MSKSSHIVVEALVEYNRYGKCKSSTFLMLEVMATIIFLLSIITIDSIIHSNILICTPCMVHVVHVELFISKDYQPINPSKSTP